MRVYKFLDDQYGIVSIEQRRLKISTIDDLNDPFELLPYDLSDREWRRVIRRTKLQLGSTRGMMCFSAGWRDPVMWAHYGKKHTGICLGFEIPDKLCKRVEYVDSRLPCPKVFSEEHIKAMLFTKFESWAYEREIRVWAALNEREDGLYFADFDDNSLKLVHVIAGAMCKLPKSRFIDALGDLSSRTTLMKARAGFTKFEIVEDERGFRNMPQTDGLVAVAGR